MVTKPNPGAGNCIPWAISQALHISGTTVSPGDVRARVVATLTKHMPDFERFWDKKAAKITAVKNRLTRQLTGGIIKARARYYREGGSAVVARMCDKYGGTCRVAAP